MKLWKVIIKTNLVSIQHYVLFVLANTANGMLNTIKQYPIVKKDDAGIESYEEIDLTDETNRVL